jgi:hypothetical protein
MPVFDFSSIPDCSPGVVCFQDCFSYKEYDIQDVGSIFSDIDEFVSDLDPDDLAAYNLGKCRVEADVMEKGVDFVLPEIEYREMDNFDLGDVTLTIPKDTPISRKRTPDKSFARDVVDFFSKSNIDECFASLEVVASLNNISPMVVPPSLLSFNDLDFQKFKAPRYVSDEIPFTDDFKYATVEAVKSYKARQIVSFWAEEAAGIRRYVSDGVSRYFIVETPDYPCSDLYYGKYRKTIDPVYSEKVIVVSLGNVLSYYLENPELFLDALQIHGFSRSISSLFICSFVPKAFPLGRFFSNSFSIFFPSQSVAGLTQITVPPKFGNSIDDQKMLSDYIQSTYPDLVENEVFVMFVDYDADEAISYCQHRCFRDKIGYYDDMAYSENIRIDKLPVFCGGGVGGKDSYKWSIAYSSVPEVDSQVFVDPLLGSDQDLDSSICVDMLEFSDGDAVYLPGIELCEVDVRRHLMIKSGKTVEAPYNGKYLYYNTGSDVYYFDYLDYSKSFTVRRMRMIAAGIPVAPAYAAPVWAKSYYVKLGHKDRCDKFYVEKKRSFDPVDRLLAINQLELELPKTHNIDNVGYMAGVGLVIKRNAQLSVSLAPSSKFLGLMKKYQRRPGVGNFENDDVRKWKSFGNGFIVATIETSGIAVTCEMLDTIINYDVPGRDVVLEILNSEIYMI